MKRQRPVFVRDVAVFRGGRTTVKKRRLTGNQQVLVPRPSPLVSRLTTGQEFSFFESSGEFTQTFNQTGSVRHLDIVTQGDAVTQRHGKSWKNTTFMIRGYMANNAAAVINHCAIYLVWDRQPNKALAGITDILEAGSGQTGSSFANRENKERFLIIKKWLRVLIGQGTGGTPTTGREAVAIDKWIKLPEECVAQTTAGDTTGAIGNRVSGALLLATVGSTVAGTGAALLNFRWRIGFRDNK